MATLEKGDFFGEMAFITSNEQRNATVVALEDTKLLYISKNEINYLLANDSSIAEKISTAVNKREKAQIEGSLKFAKSSDF